MGGKNFSHLKNVRVGIGNRELVYIRVGKMVGLGACRYEEVIEGRGYAKALRDPYSGVAGMGRVKLY